MKKKSWLIGFAHLNNARKDYFGWREITAPDALQAEEIFGKEFPLDMHEILYVHEILPVENR